MSTLDSARNALRLRQGSGARYDAEDAPAEDLYVARLGTAYFARKLNELSDAALFEQAIGEGWTRAEVVANVSYHARALCRQIEAVAAGVDPPAMYDDDATKAEDIAMGATLPARALRHLFEHSAIHLDVVWRDLPSAEWDARAPNAAGEPRPMRQTARERAELIWLSALDLSNGARQQDLPVGLQPLLAVRSPMWLVQAGAGRAPKHREPIQ